jgi:lipopolysaccharide transport system permease protein
MSSSSAIEKIADTTNEWDTILRPEAKWLDLRLGEIWRFRELVYLFVRRDFVAQYKQTILGPLWFILQPLLATIVFTVVFGNIAKLSTDGLPKMLFYLSGNILWGYFSGCLTATSSTFVSNASLFGKVYFPRLVVPISIVASQLLKLGLQFGFFLAFFLYYALKGADVHITTYALLLPFLVLLLAAISLGLGIIFSSMTTKYRDLRFLLQFGVQLLMYAAPVVYPLSSVEGNYRYLLLANPVTSIIETFRAGFLGVGTVEAEYLLYSTLFAVIVLAIGALLFTRVERTFMDTV